MTQDPDFHDLEVENERKLEQDEEEDQERSEESDG